MNNTVKDLTKNSSENLFRSVETSHRDNCISKQLIFIQRRKTLSNISLKIKEKLLLTPKPLFAKKEQIFRLYLKRLDGLKKEIM
jgi:hypothetical protein